MAQGKQIQVEIYADPFARTLQGLVKQESLCRHDGLPEGNIPDGRVGTSPVEDRQSYNEVAELESRVGLMATSSSAL